MSNEEIPYQVAPQVAALQAERANAEAYGQTDRVAAVDKQLKTLGVKAAAEERKAAADKTGAAQAKAPQGRSGKPVSKTAPEED